ncbi:uncharacterized protein LOC126902561 [Daktulosphaira vitifoliae]|uniref:uncharacterized protein LOC126902561 n=1 Tax=Daktulosphaira vitifoliae TaxID=58002 RepID=UPI0021AAD352|nr:uncharacterized protein LOC126902561 [Daktulosphaira vitifoliae]
MLDTNNEFLSIVKKEPEVINVKSEFDFISSDLKDEQMDSELTINEMEPFITINSKNYNLNNSNNHLNTVPENKIFYATSCSYCGHKLSPTVLDSDMIYSNKADITLDSNQINYMYDNNTLEPVVNIGINESKIEKLINLNSEFHWGIINNIREWDRNLIQTDNIARAIYNLGLRDACKLLQNKGEKDSIETNSSKTSTIPEVVIKNPTLNTFRRKINVEYTNNRTNNVLVNIKRKLIEKKFQKNKDRKIAKPNFIVWNKFTLAKEMPYLPLPALQLMMDSEQLPYCTKDDQKNSQQSNYNSTYQQKNLIDHNRLFIRRKKPQHILNSYKIKNFSAKN